MSNGKPSQPHGKLVSAMGSGGVVRGECFNAKAQSCGVRDRMNRIYRMLLPHPVHPVEKAHGRRQQYLEGFAPACRAEAQREGRTKILDGNAPGRFPNRMVATAVVKTNRARPQARTAG